jgi:hypothetical protein
LASTGSGGGGGGGGLTTGALASSAISTMPTTIGSGAVDWSDSNSFGKPNAASAISAACKIAEKIQPRLLIDPIHRT